MKRSFKSIFRRFLGWGFLLLAAVNIVVLGGVAANRSGEPEARVLITERELQPPYSTKKENSGLSLRLVWRVPVEEDGEDGYRYWRSPAWFNAAKVAELGLESGGGGEDGSDDARWKEPVAKEVFIVLELGGEPYQRALEQSERTLIKEKEMQGVTSSADLTKNDDISRKDKLRAAMDRLEEERFRSSRLFAVDAGLDSKILRGKHPDRSKYIIAKGVVEAANHGARNTKEIRGRITMLLIENIHVPLQHRALFEDAMARKQMTKADFNGSGYTVELLYGSRFEPWIASLTSTKAEAN